MITKGRHGAVSRSCAIIKTFLSALIMPPNGRQSKRARIGPTITIKELINQSRRCLSDGSPHLTPPRSLPPNLEPDDEEITSDSDSEQDLGMFNRFDSLKINVQYAEERDTDDEDLDVEEIDEFPELEEEDLTDMLLGMTDDDDDWDWMPERLQRQAIKQRKRRTLKGDGQYAYLINFCSVPF